jgi:outer membrane protein W
MALTVGLVGSPAASAQQSIDFFLGGFTPTSLDARGNDDVIFQNGAYLSTLNRQTGIDINQFNGPTIGAEYLVGLGRNLEAGLGISFYQRTVPTVDTYNVDGATGADIPQDLKLRIVPLTATIRFLPFGNDASIQPYIGGGVGVYLWRYSETGQFLDSKGNIFNGNFVGSGSEVGPVALGGVRVPIGGVKVGGEVRWQKGSATLPADQSFAGPKINLGGFNYLLTVSFRF